MTEISCPVCHVKMDQQEPYAWDNRSYQHYICDNHLCRVSSLRIEWRTQP
jgi:hypothetical protein